MQPGERDVYYGLFSTIPILVYDSQSHSVRAETRLVFPVTLMVHFYTSTVIPASRTTFFSVSTLHVSTTFFSWELLTLTLVFLLSGT